MRKIGCLPALLAALVLSGCVTAGGPPPSGPVRGKVHVPPDIQAARGERAIGSLRLIGEQRIAHRQQFAGTTVGGLSGADYDARSGDWVLVSDDRSSINPARFYRVKLHFDAGTFAPVTVTQVDYFLQADGTTYPNAGVAGGDVPDLESIRVDPLDGSIWYASEGERRRGLDPYLRHAARDGKLLGSLPLPEMFKVYPGREYGVRENAAFEGFSFAPDGKSLWLALEAPLYQDGALPTPQKGALTRLSRFDRHGALLTQYAYPIEPIAQAPAPGKEADNGISEILAVDDSRLLVLERAGVEQADGSYLNFVRLYETDTAAASDVRDVPSFLNAPEGSVRPASKRLLLDLNSLGLPRVDNLEAVAWGPRLANGHETLLLVSDDNFRRAQVTQFLLFEVLPP
ncbi:esterase-like activity of phytase family protein [Pseudoduganella violacea]|uniref:Phytase-like domain-containing protein n=1 Tax=Pseudoduganella violacea TaxID=1715466 RepID=A0A7W5BEG3_9BURK|nr:esterase-like activity of phytase family protein [Pseudoduganella violacea]MBB3120720.1 hypothetical protein [Pseudoduganella violacea]